MLDLSQARVINPRKPKITITLESDRANATFENFGRGMQLSHIHVMPGGEFVLIIEPDRRAENGKGKIG